MAWNTEETKRQLKEAAAEEFAARGLHGARMEQIAQRAGINKERLYNYFGNKERLFSTVLAEELTKAAAAVPISSLEVEDIAEYAGRAFDYHVANPRLTRLLHWEGLTSAVEEVSEESERQSHYHDKVAALANAGHGAAHGLTTEDLLFSVLSVVCWRFATPQVERMIVGPVSTEKALAARRAAVVEAARRLALQHDEDPSAPGDEPNRDQLGGVNS